MTAGRREGGFTLLELLVSLAIFAVLSVIAYQGLQTVLDARERIESEAARITALQALFAIMGRDLEQAVGRPIRDDFGDRQPALRGSDAQLELSRSGRRNPAALPRSHLQRIAYLLADGQLVRRSWPVLDRPLESPAQDTVLADGILNLEFRYLDRQRQWQRQWPAPAARDNPPPERLPRAIEVVLEVEEWGVLRRLFRLPQAIDVESGQNEDQNPP